MSDTYLNPVYNHTFADPFVLKYRGEYWAYCTGMWQDERCFGILRSRDLVGWEAVGGAMEPLAEPHPHYWAPEVTYHNGTFYLYYSVGDEATMHIRVAVAEHPAGPFIDSGRRLTSEPFAIDAHVFIDENGDWHLFYATDFLDHTHVGTGTTRDRLLDPYTLAGKPIPVSRPRYDWHVYDPQRAEKGGVRWHTIEGPFVLEHKGRFYQMFSGGNWQNLSYGVSYAMTDAIDTHAEWEQVADGERVAPILRTVPGKVIGPGHNSVVRGPDNLQLYCVYHRWADDGSGRRLAIDRMDWAGERMLVLGPTTTPEPAPIRPAIADFFDGERQGGLGTGWYRNGGSWSAQAGAATQTSLAGTAAAERAVASPSFVVEVSLRALDDPFGGRFGVAFGSALSVLLSPAQHQLVIRTQSAGEAPAEECFPLPDAFNAGAYHLLRVEVDGDYAFVSLDERALRGTARLQHAAIKRVALVTERVAAAFSGFALTVGWQDLFMTQSVSPADIGWQADAPGDWHIESGSLTHTSQRAEQNSTIVKGPLLDAYELVVNARLDASAAPDGSYGFYPAWRPEDSGPLLTVEHDREGWALRCRNGSSEQLFALPDFDATIFQQFRFRKLGRQLTIQWESRLLAKIDAPSAPTQVGLSARGAAVFEMVRLTAIG